MNVSKSGKSRQQKTALDKFNDYQSSESARLAEKQKMEHELKMATAQNKQLKYEFKMKSQAADHKNQLELLHLQIQLAQVNAAAAATSALAVVPANSAPTMTLATPGLFNTPIASTSTVPATPVLTYKLELSKRRWKRLTCRGK